MADTLASYLGNFPRSELHDGSYRGQANAGVAPCGSTQTRTCRGTHRGFKA